MNITNGPQTAGPQTAIQNPAQRQESPGQRKLEEPSQTDKEKKDLASLDPKDCCAIS